MYNENSLFLESGKYQFSSLKNIPAIYLINIRNQTKDEDLKSYINLNIDKLKTRADFEKNKKAKVIINCKKICFLTEKEAMKDLQRISKRKQENKKPIRVYKCLCGAYHLTSKQVKL